MKSISLLASQAAVALGETRRLENGSAPAFGRATIGDRDCCKNGRCDRFDRSLGRFDCPPTACRQRVKIGDGADDAAPQEADQQHEDDAEHELPCRTKVQRVLKEVAEIEPYDGPDQRPEQRASAADRSLHDKLPGRIERKRVRRHEALHDGEEAAGEAGIGGCDHEGGEFVAMDVVAEGGRAQRVVAQRAQDRSHWGPDDAQCDHQADEVPERKEDVHFPVGVEAQLHKAKVETRRRHPGQAVFSTRKVRQGIELDEEEHFPDRHRDHGEIDAGAPERDQADEIADHARDHGADRDRG